MILEGLVTTLGHDGVLNVAPMGPHIEPGSSRFVLRPYRTSTTFRNLRERREGVLHVTDDVLLLARTAIGLPVDPPTREAERVSGRILTGACRYQEFRVVEIDEQDDRTTVQAEALAHGVLREFFGFNRAKHAVIEAAILATRTEFLPSSVILDEFRRLAIPVGKTGGPDEHEAFRLLHEYVVEVTRRRELLSDRVDP